MTDKPSDTYQLVWQVVALTVVLELLTVTLRFGLDLESARDTAATIGVLTLGLRVHHGLCGLLVLLVAWGASREFPKLAHVGLVIGWALFLSDAIHHFLVLWPVTGSPQFDLFYKS